MASGRAELDRDFGRQAFGGDPAGYDRARPAYPDWVYETLKVRCGLGPGCVAFEIGAGTGIATRRLLREGASVVAVEPDRRLAAFLEASVESRALQVVNAPFDTAQLDEAAFDLGVCATAFHWLDEDLALARIASLLKPGGWWAAVWNLFGDDSRPDPFHDATTLLFEGAPASPGSNASGGPEYGLDAERRIGALRRAGAFEAIEHQVSQWSLELTADETVALYATYSNVNARADRADLLAALHKVAREPPFSDRVVRNMTTSLFIARRA
ncbi:MAG TPA: class I SAM-dependent methyltransferase [Caulobacteraceae bacterium]|jgi:SAM-dependent methyltransferase|nr:class I SAM-dependent methyltransferase [Caulobacteraceae bacterium]